MGLLDGLLSIFKRGDKMSDEDMARKRHMPQGDDPNLDQAQMNRDVMEKQMSDSRDKREADAAESERQE